MAAPADHEERMGGHHGHVLADGLVDVVSAAAGQFPEAAPGDGRLELGPAASVGGDVEQGGQQVEQRASVGDRPARRDPGTGHDERHAGRALEEGHLEEHTPVAEHVAVVAGDDDHAAVQAAGLGQRIDQAAQPGVEVAGGRVVAVAGVAALVLGESHGVGLDALADAQGVGSTSSCSPSVSMAGVRTSGCPYASVKCGANWSAMTTRRLGCRMAGR